MTERQIVFEGKNHLLTQQIIRVFFQVYNELGHGFLESVYREAMRIALVQEQKNVVMEAPIPVSFRGQVVGVFRADLLVEGEVILELKVSDRISKTHEGQLTHYLMASDAEIGLILNFGETPSFRRVIMTNDRKRRREPTV